MLRNAGVVELVDTQDLKSCYPWDSTGSIPVSGTTHILLKIPRPKGRAGSSPAPGTSKINRLGAHLGSQLFAVKTPSEHGMRFRRLNAFLKWHKTHL